MTLINFLFYLTIASIFSEEARYTTSFDLKLFYFVVVFGMVVFVLFKKVRYTRGLLLFHFLILINGFFTLLFGYNSPKYFTMQLVFLLLIPIYYYSFYQFYRDRFSQMVRVYCQLALALAVIGLLKYPYDVSIGWELHSIMREPAHYCTIVLPAMYITLKDRSYPRYYFVIILITLILSGSSLGILGLGLVMLFYPRKISLSKIMAGAVIVVGLGAVTYFNFEKFKTRVDDTVVSSISGDLSEANLSTYALVSNFFVAFKSFKANPILGNGIGSHINSRAKYLKEIKGVEVFEKMHMEHLNAQDAASLFSRIMSEQGLIGIVGVFFFIWKFYVTNKEDQLTSYAIISRAIILYFFAKLFREGHYFSPEMYFFVFMYVFNKWEYLKWKKEQLTPIKIQD